MNGADLFLILAVFYLCYKLIQQYKKEKSASRTIKTTHYKESKK